MEEQKEGIDFQANEKDIEQQEKEMERQKKVEQYRRRFEEALIRIEDHDDVVAMQDAQKELRDNDEEDLHEFENDETKVESTGAETTNVKKINDGISIT